MINILKRFSHRLNEGLMLLFFIFLFSHASNAQTGLDIATENFQSIGMFDSAAWKPKPNLSGNNGTVDVVLFEGSYVVRMGKISDGNFTANALDWHVNLDNADQVALTFSLYNRNDETHINNDPQKANQNDGIFFSSNGGNSFVKVYNFDPSNWCSGYGNLPPIDVDRIVDNHPGLTLNSQFVIRFQQYDNSDFGSFGDEDGFYLDNFRLYDPQTTYDTLPFSDDFQANGFLGSAWAWGNPGSTSDSIFTTLNGSYGLSLGQGASGASGDYAVAMGKRCDGNAFIQKFHANALDLHLNLAGKDQVALVFALKNFGEETHAEDGIWFSSNGGDSFTQIYQFKFAGDWCTGTYGYLPPLDLDELIKVDPSLSFTSQCVIRFQQYDDADFGNFGDEDGFQLDLISVYEPEIEFIDEYPFSDAFEANGELGNWWTWGYAAAVGDLGGTADPSTITGNGTFGLSSNGGIGNSYGAFMGKRCDEQFHTNAFDLHLNLSNTKDAKFSFYLQNIANEPHPEDGLFISTDNGISFTQIDTFDFSTFPVNQFKEYSINLDSALASKGLTPSAKTIVRIQQYDDADFGSFGDEDGYYIDSVKVSLTETTSLEKENLDDWQIYPNPSSDLIFIKHSSQFNKAIKVKISDLSGRTLIEQEEIHSPVSLDISNFPVGIYMIEINDHKNSLVKKLIKN